MALRSSKPLVWLRGEVKTPPFSAVARVEAGFWLRRLQMGEPLGLPLSRPMPSVGSHCLEPRIPDRDQSWRVMYLLCHGRGGRPGRVRQEDRGDTEGRSRHLPAASGCLSAACARRGGPMKADKKRRLERAGWVVGDAAGFLGLSPQAQQFVDVKLSLAIGVRMFRERSGLTQSALAKQLGSSQSRVAKMEAADSSVSVDLMMRSLLSIGATPNDIARMIKKSEAA